MDLKCPRCSRFLAEIGVVAGATGRTVCRDCGIEMTVRVKGKEVPA